MDDPRLWDLIDSGAVLHMERINTPQSLTIFQRTFLFQFMEIYLDVSGVTELDISYTLLNDTTRRELVCNICILCKTHICSLFLLV